MIKTFKMDGLLFETTPLGLLRGNSGKTTVHCSRVYGILLFFEINLPEEGQREANSAKQNAPINDIQPHTTQTIRVVDTDLSSLRTPVGEMNIPLPMITPNLNHDN